MSDRNIRWAKVSKVSNDKGPYKMMEVTCDGKAMMAMHGESFGVQSVPHQDAQVLVCCPDGDEGKAVIIASMPRPKDRQDQQQEGEGSFMIHDADNRIHHKIVDKDNKKADTNHTSSRDITHTSERNHVLKTKGGVFFVNCDG